MSPNNSKALYLDDNEDLEKRVEDLLSRLKFDEKVSLLTGYTGFSTKPIERLKIPEFGMTDGPHGASSHSSFKTKNTYFPAAITLAASWNPDLAHEYGQVLAEEVKAVGRHCVLAPGINIHRTPLCGRNFEYFTEDPYLNSRMVVPLIQGIQSKQISACVKHYICNNTEVRRRFSNSVVSERALEEIYYPGFKAAISEGNVWMVMGAYNKVNGHYVYENHHLLTEKLRDDWGFQGFVVSDWLATHTLDSPGKCIKAGFMLEMPKKFIYDEERVMQSFKAGEFEESDLDANLRGFLRVLFLVGLFDKKEKREKGSRNTKEHYATASKIIEEGAVLLKNENGTLPIKLEKIKKICLNGPLVDYIPFIKSIGGSSSVKPPFWDTVKAIFEEKLCNNVEFTKKPEAADVVVHVTGITQWFYGDSEGMDKDSIKLSKKKVKKIKKLAKKNNNLVVVLINGGPLSIEE